MALSNSYLGLLMNRIEIQQGNGDKTQIHFLNEIIAK
jgi:hypothetical protein